MPSKKTNIMNALKKLSVLVLLFSMGFGVNARNEDEKLNLPGDNLNLYAVMDLFQQSETLEGFEKSLNAEDSKINNLDLNGNNLIDYIKVIDYVDGDDHTIVLQVAINEHENQDVAVFTVIRDRKGQVQIQLVGDEYLYGKDYIIEPNYDDNMASETPNPGYTGNNVKTVVVTRTTYVEVAAWPVVRFIYLPTYSVWRSPYYWGYYPVYWNPWRPYYWDYYYGYHSHWHNHYYAHYRHCNYYRYSHYNDQYYHGHRAYSTTVHAYRDNGRYRDTYSRPDLREEGSKDFKRNYAYNGRASTRPERISRGDNKSGYNSDNARVGRQADVNRSTTRPSGNRDVNKAEPRQGNNHAGDRSTVKPSGNREVNKAEPRQGSNRAGDRSAVRTSGKREINKAEPRQGNNHESAKPAGNRSSERSTARPSNNRSVNKSESRQGSNRESVKSGGDNRSSVRSSGKSSDRQVSKPAGRSSKGESSKTSARSGSKSGKSKSDSKGRGGR